MSDDNFRRGAAGGRKKEDWTGGARKVEKGRRLEGN